MGGRVVSGEWVAVAFGVLAVAAIANGVAQWYLVHKCQDELEDVRRQLQAMKCDLREVKFLVQRMQKLCKDIGGA